MIHSTTDCTARSSHGKYDKPNPTKLKEHKNTIIRRERFN